MPDWLGLGANHYVLVTEGALLNTGLVVGLERAMVIDTGCGPGQGREILDAVREKTDLPLVVVNFHAPMTTFSCCRVRRCRRHRVLGARKLCRGH